MDATVKKGKLFYRGNYLRGIFFGVVMLTQYRHMPMVVVLAMKSMTRRGGPLFVVVQTGGRECPAGGVSVPRGLAGCCKDLSQH